MELMVIGMVEVFAQIQPKILSFTGKTGESATGVAIIVPRPDHPFEVKNIRARNGQDIRFNIDKTTRAGQAVYQLTVTGSRQTPGRISDVIYLETDSKIRPTLQVPVFGTIIEAKKEPS